MAQDKIMELFSRSKRWLTTKQVSIKLKVNRSSTTRKLNQLAKYRLIKREPCKVLIKAQKHVIFRYRRK